MSILATAPSRLSLDHLGLRLRVARYRTRLDAALAEGADPADDPALALRAQQLTEPAALRSIASTLDNILDAAEEPPDAWSPGGPSPPLQREAILAARDQMHALADRLRGAGHPSPQAAALAALLVWDSASPIYADRSEATTVARWASTAIDALTPSRH